MTEELTPQQAATASADAVSTITSKFMLDMDTYARGGALGFDGVDFYVAGRGGVLGEVPADVVAAAFVWFNPEMIAAAWERSASVLPRAEAGRVFAEIGHEWGRTHLPDEATAGRLADLAEKISLAASPAAAPLFAAWRTLPPPQDARGRAIHHLNALRELRGALHGAALIAHGIDTHAAVAHRSPYMLGIFGWAEPHPEVDLTPAWTQADALTDVALAPAYAALDADERVEFVDLANQTLAAIR